MPSHIISYHIKTPRNPRAAQAQRGANSDEKGSDNIHFNFPPSTSLLKLTNLIQFNGSELSIKAAEKTLAGSAVRAVRLGEDNDGVLVNEALGLSLCGGHCGG